MGEPTAVAVDATSTSNPPVEATSATHASPDTDKLAIVSTVVNNIYHNLSDDEKEQAARASSYRYFVIFSSPTEKEGRDQQREKHSKNMIERYVTVEKKLNQSKSPDTWEAQACLKLKNTLQYREEKHVDAIRLCFHQEKLGDDGLHSNLRDGLTKRFGSKASVIRGYTIDGQAMFQNFAKNDSNWDDREFFIKGNIYMLERALACTERNTDGEKDKVVAFYDYNGYGLKNTPPVMFAKELLFDLRDHWPERLQQVFMVDTPFVFRAFWMIIKHFIDPITKELVHFITGEEQKQLLRKMIGEDQAAPFMFDGGKNGKEVDNETFFYNTPFDHVYGEC